MGTDWDRTRTRATVCAVIRSPLNLPRRHGGRRRLLAACGSDANGIDNDNGNDAGALPDGCAAADGSSARKDTFDEAPPICLVDGKQYKAIIETTAGTVHVNLATRTSHRTP